MVGVNIPFAEVAILVANVEGPPQFSDRES